MIIKKGKVIKTNGIKLPASLLQAYRHTSTLVSHTHKNHNKKARKTAITKYNQRIRQVLKSQLSDKARPIYVQPII